MRGQKKTAIRELQDQYQKCSKKLAPFLSEITLVFEQNRKVILNKKVREKLFSISAATIDRLLADIRKKQCFKGKSSTRPGSLLKKNIPSVPSVID